MRPLEPLGFEVVFHADWWRTNYDFDFGANFYFDPDTPVSSERRMTDLLKERFPGLDIGSGEDRDISIFGPLHFACGFLIPSAFGCEVWFSTHEPPEVIRNYIRYHREQGRSPKQLDSFD